MLNDENNLKNCPLCGSDKIGVIRTNEAYILGRYYYSADIECVSCGTIFKLNGKTKEKIISLWNGDRQYAERGK